MQQRSKYNRTDESNEERVSKQQKKDGEISDCRTHASTAKEHKSRLKHSCQDPLKKEQASKQLRRGSRNCSLSLYGKSDTTDPISTGEPLSIQTPTTQDSGATAARSAKAHSIHHSAPKKTRSKTNILAKVVLDRKAQVKKKRRRYRKSSNLSTLGSPLLQRRGSQIRKPPDRF